MDEEHRDLDAALNCLLTSASRLLHEIRELRQNARESHVELFVDMADVEALAVRLESKLVSISEQDF